MQYRYNFLPIRQMLLFIILLLILPQELLVYSFLFILQVPISKMDDKSIEKYLWQLENGELSEDEDYSDEDAIDYNTNVGELAADFVNDVQEEEQAEVDEYIESDPPRTLHEVTENQPEVTDYSTARNLVWKKKNITLVEKALLFQGVIEYPLHILDLETAFQFFTYFFENCLLEKIVTESNKYATQNNPNFSDPLTILELRKYVGILIYTSVYHYPSIRSYWASNVRFDPIANSMTINRFEKIRQILHFNDNTEHLPSEHPDHDRLHKTNS